MFYIQCRLVKKVYVVLVKRAESPLAAWGVRGLNYYIDSILCSSQNYRS